MDRIQATEEVETPKSGKPIGSIPNVSSRREAINWKTLDHWIIRLPRKPNKWIEPHELDGTVKQLTEPAAIAEAAQLQEQVGNNFSSQDHSTCRMVGNSVIGHPWTTGLFDCHEHQTNAIMTAILPCVTFGQIAEILDGGEMTCLLGSFIYLLMMPALCSQWIMGSKYRTKLRRRYDLVEAPYEDVISHVFCPLCSLCQEFRELKNRGLDPALGWNGILAQQQGRQYHDQQVQTPPPVQAMSMEKL